MSYDIVKKDLSKLGEDLAKFSPEVFITFASFEERSTKIASYINNKDMQCIICSFASENRHEIENLKVLKNLFPSSDIATYSVDNPFAGIDNLLSLLKKTKSINKRILVDITTFSRESLLVFISAMYAIHDGRFDNLCFVYNPAQDYDPGKALQDKKLSFGVKDIRSVLGFFGRHDPAKSMHLIVTVGYEIDRAINIIEEFEPAKLTLGFGHKEASSTTDIYRENKETYTRLVGMLSPEYGAIEEFVFTANDPFKMKAELIELVEKNEKYNSIIIPMNTKISCVGAGLAALENKSIQIAYAQPESYNFDNYATPSNDYYLFSIVMT